MVRKEDAMEQSKGEQRRPETEERPEKPGDPAAAHPTKEENQDEDERDEAVDEVSADSFPSSDPPSW